jgi:tRNA-splicing ligase RtcB (3'-phosphate/5'-hydroxy nucleic acid ligase)
MNSKQLIELGVPKRALNEAGALIVALREGGADMSRLPEEMAAIVSQPEAFLGDPLRAALARELYEPAFKMREVPAPWHQWGEGLDAAAVAQLANACTLPISVAGALMPDAHVGYGLPIGGVLATENAVIPYAVGVDIACRMKLTVYDRKASTLAGMRDRLANIIEDETRFGMGAEFEARRNHDVMDDDWTVSPITKHLREKAWKQLGTSGSGNHFVEFGEFTVNAAESLRFEQDGRHIPPGNYLALLSHSGSRGTGAQVCQHYSRIAMDRHAKLPAQLKHLAWLDLASEPGAEYWAAMELMGRYAAANHACIHKYITKKVGAAILLDVENHHNFAWKEQHNGREVIVHRKGATPAGAGVMGIIPGSMATPGFVVRGRGKAESLNSASHGAGRVMSRTKAQQSFTWSTVRKQLKAADVELLSAGIDECPGVYKDIHTVMSAQTDLVDVMGTFMPRIVKMSPPGDKAED